MSDVTLLAIESSCDETAAAIVVNGRKVLSNVISSQIDIHKLYGGVVPEIASRKHIEQINQVIEQAFVDAEKTLDDVDGICVTYGPGLVGALLVGVGAAKAISYASGKPLIGVHHIEGHISANYICHPELEPPFCVSWYPAGTVILFWSTIMVNMRSLDVRGMMPQGKHLTKWHVLSDWGIPGDRRSMLLHQAAIKMRLPFRVLLWKMHRMTSVSAG